MKCRLSPCMFPGCTARAWTLKDASPANVRAFLDDVKACMEATGRPFGKAAAWVVADKSGCLLA